MSRVKKRIAIYSNLPSGGANILENLYTQSIQKVGSIVQISDSYVHPKNLLHYMFQCLILLPIIHKKLAKQISDSTDILICHHSWLTKSPHLLRYYKGPKIYICQELLREYYDQDHISAQSLKDRIINIIRLPIKYVDRKNLRSTNLQVVANSIYSKKLIDKFYNINSHLIYPGINISEFKKNKITKQMNQIISVGAINKLKRYEFIIKVISNIELDYRPMLVVIGNGGDPEYVEYIKKLSKTLNVKIKVIINASRSLLIKEYLKSKIFVYAPISEPFGIVLEEAMAAGLPILAYKNGGGYSEIISDRNGIILDDLNPEMWSKMLIKMLQNTTMLRRYSKYNLKYVKKYDFKFMTNNLIKMILTKL